MPSELPKRGSQTPRARPGMAASSPKAARRAASGTPGDASPLSAWNSPKSQ